MDTKILPISTYFIRLGIYRNLPRRALLFKPDSKSEEHGLKILGNTVWPLLYYNFFQQFLIRRGIKHSLHLGWFSLDDNICFTVECSEVNSKFPSGGLAGGDKT